MLQGRIFEATTLKSEKQLISMKFSQRIGITPLTKNLQIDSIDQDLKNGLWNSFRISFIEPFDKLSTNIQIGQVNIFTFVVWHDHFKWNIETIPRHLSEIKYFLHNWFFDKASWHEIYDFVDFLSNGLPPLQGINSDNFIFFANEVLEREFSAYRFVNGRLSPITNKHEKTEIEEALNNSASFTQLSGCNIHLTHALKLLSDRTNPDYRNSIKESISAIESLVKVISEKPKATLGEALTSLKPKIGLHPALEGGFKQIYGYTNDSSGIRHALMDESNCDFDDAKYMLVSCSAFINYLICKAQKAGFTLS